MELAMECVEPTRSSYTLTIRKKSTVCRLVWTHKVESVARAPAGAMSGPLGRAIAEVAISVAVSAGKRALKKAMNDPAKPRAIATARDRPMPAMAKFLQLRSRGRYRNGTHAHAAAELACMQDRRL